MDTIINNNLEYYKIFYYVVKTGSFTNAAQKLCISQPAISQSIKILEKNLGSRLFFRTSKGVKLTTEGEVLFSYVERGYETILLGEEMFLKMMEYEGGEIRIGASDMTLQFYLLPYLEQFHEKYPKIKVTVTNAPTPETLEYLYAGKIDFGIVSEPFEAKTDITVTKVREIEDIFIAGNRFLEYRNRTVEYKELEYVPIICLEHNTSTRTYMEEFLRKSYVELKPEFELATSDMIVQFVLRNLGIGCVVKDFVEEKIKEKKIFALQFSQKMPKRNICIIKSEKFPITKAAKQLLTSMI